MKRRRFLQIAAMAVMARRASAAEWQGVALGADVSVSLTGPGADGALADLPAFLERIEATFSLYRASELTRLNETSAGLPSAWMRHALMLCDRLHRMTGGIFDPTVQPLWRALAEGDDTASARRLIGWHRVALRDEVILQPGQALTLNGMAQGFAADLVRDWLAARGFTHALVNMGEQAALGGPFRLAVEDVTAGDVGQLTISGTALAASSPAAMMVGGQSHILHPKGIAPRWSTVAVEADSAALADGLSTALVFADETDVAFLKATTPDLHRVVLVDAAGNLRVL